MQLHVNEYFGLLLCKSLGSVDDNPGGICFAIKEAKAKYTVPIECEGGSFGFYKVFVK
jgi:hypothetical protein